MLKNMFHKVINDLGISINPEPPTAAELREYFEGVDEFMTKERYLVYYIESQPFYYSEMIKDGFKSVTHQTLNLTCWDEVNGFAAIIKYKSK